MTKPEETPLQVPSDRKSPWERPTVMLAGKLSLLVRAGSALGKRFEVHDGDATNPRSHPF
jgi:hypothetical protein